MIEIGTSDNDQVDESGVCCMLSLERLSVANGKVGGSGYRRGQRVIASLQKRSHNSDHLLIDDNVQVPATNLDCTGFHNLERHRSDDERIDEFELFQQIRKFDPKRMEYHP